MRFRSKPLSEAQKVILENLRRGVEIVRHGDGLTLWCRMVPGCPSVNAKTVERLIIRGLAKAVPIEGHFPISHKLVLMEEK